MAKKDVKLTKDPEDVMAWTPTIPGIGKPLGIVEAGREGAKAVHDVSCGMGQLNTEDEFRSYPDVPEGTL